MENKKPISATLIRDCNTYMEFWLKICHYYNYLCFIDYRTDEMIIFATVSRLTKDISECIDNKTLDTYKGGVLLNHLNEIQCISHLEFFSKRQVRFDEINDEDIPMHG